jgi:hypothetical protein
VLIGAPTDQDYKSLTPQFYTEVKASFFARKATQMNGFMQPSPREDASYFGTAPPKQCPILGNYTPHLPARFCSTIIRPAWISKVPCRVGESNSKPI